MTMNGNGYIKLSVFYVLAVAFPSTRKCDEDARLCLIDFN